MTRPPTQQATLRNDGALLLQLLIQGEADNAHVFVYVCNTYV